MSRRCFAFAAFLVLFLVGAAVPGQAAAAGFDIGLVRAGMPLAELRHAAWPAGARLLCGGDADLPAKLDSPPQGGIVLPPRLAKSGLIPCALFAPDAKGTWKMARTDFAGAPAGVWALAIAVTPGAEPVVFQAKLWQAESAFKATVAYVTARLGRPEFAAPSGARWTNSTSEALVGHLSSGGIQTTLTDTSLEPQVDRRTSQGLPKLKGKGKPAH